MLAVLSTNVSWSLFLSREVSLTVFRLAECSCRSLPGLRFGLNIQMIEDIAYEIGESENTLNRQMTLHCWFTPRFETATSVFRSLQNPPIISFHVEYSLLLLFCHLSIVLFHLSQWEYRYNHFHRNFRSAKVPPGHHSLWDRLLHWPRILPPTLS